MKMKKMFLILLIFFALAVFSVVILEVLSKKYQCPIVRPPISACNIRPTSILPQTDSELSEIRVKRDTKERITKEEYRQLAEKFVREVDPNVLSGFYNGIACGNFGYVRNDLPKEAKKYVKRHELEHLLQTGKEKNPEFSANWAAAKEYPLGFLQTIFFSAQNRAKYSDSSTCYIVSSWKTFKIYMLP